MEDTDLQSSGEDCHSNELSKSSPRSVDDPNVNKYQMAPISDDEEEDYNDEESPRNSGQRPSGPPLPAPSQPPPSSDAKILSSILEAPKSQAANDETATSVPPKPIVAHRPSIPSLPVMPPVGSPKSSTLSARKSIASFPPPALAPPPLHAGSTPLVSPGASSSPQVSNTAQIPSSSSSASSVPTTPTLSTTPSFGPAFGENAQAADLTPVAAVTLPTTVEIKPMTAGQLMRTRSGTKERKSGTLRTSAKISPRASVAEDATPTATPPSSGGSPASPISIEPIHGELFLYSPQLPFANWVNCEFSLVGNQLRWCCRDPVCYATIDVNLITVVTHDLTAIPTLNNIPTPPTNFSFVVTTATEQFVFAAQEAALATKWQSSIRLSSSLQASSGGSPSSASPSSIQLASSPSALTKRKSKKIKTGEIKDKDDDTPISQAVQQLIKQRLGSLGTSISTTTYNLLRLIFNGKFKFVIAIFAIAQSADADKIATSLAKMFYYVDRPLQLLNCVIGWEVERTQLIAQLFRQDSLASKMMTAYTRLIATNYLTFTLKRSIHRIVMLGRQLEINPDVLNDEEKGLIEDRKALLRSTLDDLLGDICSSANAVPTECRVICTYLRDAVSEKFPDEPKATEVSLAGFLFLRLINPAIAVPDTIGIVQTSDLTPHARRALVVVSKVLLAMATQVEFHKEPYLVDMNSYVKEKLPMVQAFIKECVDVSPDALLSNNPAPAADMVITELGPLYRILYASSEKLALALSAAPNLQKRMKQCFTSIGPPPAANVATSPATETPSKRDSKGAGSLPRPLPLPPDLAHFLSKSVSS